ncbi:VanZ family protein [Paenibacillus methanolicus]|uniref:VanZ like protein n=1 Tax=Paenibacillus methanolicus TaxID=582686 RepID=A0A5S5CJP6_9BACL|nr:VanZ family protein [Paenibacillus methanolicus]TYP79127.1 VanZ like protein [Paenibacillus methanolicus]
MSISFTIQSWLVLLPVAIVLCSIAAARTFIAKRYSFRQFALLAAFTVYATGVLHFVVFPIEVNIGEFANKTPWYRTIQWIPILTMDAKTFLLNVVLFVPFGLGLPLLCSSYKRMRHAAKASIYASIAFEMIQLAIRIVAGNGRMTDMNDLIANTLGGVLGYIVYRKLIAMKPIERLLSGYRLSSRDA